MPVIENMKPIIPWEHRYSENDMHIRLFRFNQCLFFSFVKNKMARVPHLGESKCMSDRDGIFRGVAAVGFTYSTPMVANHPFNEAELGKLEADP